MPQKTMRAIVLEMQHLNHLNEPQRQAVLHREGPLLIIAGAGAGKTRVITHRIAELIRNGVAPEEILAVTFTNKAAKEMRQRVSALIESDRELNLPVSIAERPFIATFHALGAHIIREHAALLGIRRHFKIYDRSDSLRAIKEAMRAAGLDPKTIEPRKLLGAISRQKGNAIGAPEYAERAGNDFFERVVSAVWRAYERTLAAEHALDFDDLLLKNLLLLKTHKEVRERYQRLWRYVHIDEYQDTNTVQNEIADIIASDGNLCVVGDLDQNIYSWRGAKLQNLLEFEANHPDTTVILLEENYRSTKTILRAANDIIQKNKNRREKTLFTANAEGERLSLYSAYDEADEAMFVARKAQELIAHKTPPSEIAVLYRANFQSRALEEAMLGAGVPHQVLGVRFFERKEVKDILSFLRAALNPESMTDVKRIVNVPPRGIGKVTLLAMFSGKESALPAGAREKVAHFRRLLANIQTAITECKPSDTIRTVLARSGIEEKLKSGTEDDMERLENIRELVTLATKYDALPQGEGIEALLTDAALATDQDELRDEHESVKLMTVHAAKGLEFEVVFITGLEDGLFPHAAVGDDPHSGGRDEEEERRLFYVALTRARKKVFLSFASLRTIFGSPQIGVPSEFIIDLGDDYLEVLQPETRREKTIYLE